MPQPKPAHTYDSTCRLAPHGQHRRNSHQDDHPPPVLARFFYSSPSSVDDPLSSGDLSAANSEAKLSRGQYRPFSAEDNHALEEAWISLICDHDRQAHREANQTRKSCPALTTEYAKRLSGIVRRLVVKHHGIHGPNYRPPDPATLEPPPLDGPEPTIPVCCQGLYHDVETEVTRSFCAVARARQHQLGHSNVILKVMEEFNRVHSPIPSQAGPHAFHLQSESAEPANPANARPRSSSSPDDAKPADKPQISQSPPRQQIPAPLAISSRALPADDGISGKPFIRVGSPRSTPASRPSSAQGADASVSHVEPRAEPPPIRPRQDATSARTRPENIIESQPDDLSADVVVGVSRLHMVSLPALHMQPIYWSPINDNAVAMRATWFYRDTMLPVPPEVANQLEEGYHELRPWTETWNDELKCAVEVGPLGEEKVSHRLWPDRMPDTGKDTLKDTPPDSHMDPFCAARCFKGEVAAEGILNPQPLALTREAANSSNAPPKAFSSYHVIYRDRNEAFLLKPSLKPSGYYGRRPVAKIMRGATVGVPVVRGFDEAAWNRYHSVAPSKEKKPGATQRGSGLSNLDSSRLCPACETDKKDAQVSDLVLVIHGIGQKFAERVESYHFTHAINAFRRSVNSELSDPLVKGVLKDGNLTRIMVLPVNWRHNLSFEDGGPMTDSDKTTHAPDWFGLKDIEPPTIPAVRGLISDIMFDIPFYMSKHKSKMIHALIAEANRVHRLWCQNNPGFAEHGRVHLIAHSLGSAMALDILSRQPTCAPKLDLSSPSTSTTRFEFDTSNLFLLGSPAAFFLLLERASLTPRGGRMKPGADSSDTTSKDVVGEAGTFGCLAVDNIYNILAKEDPIAYLLNGTIDPAYAASLETAYVPSTTTSLFQTMGNALRSLVPGASLAPNLHGPAPTKPTVLRLPSQLELEVHDFTREEIAEKKAYLLNDNGQLDYYLQSGGGPLEIQYLNMLGAHSSYWGHRDFVRMVCIEIGRKPGRSSTLPVMRAVKVAAQRLVPPTQ
ncbi:related to phosphatidic acid-preferring phospholipase A1 [Cephalotrichum gorgonifer]|uniref:Related to phosphatidic acid-preferring phospholipase A1 n=1 Tax=Cephalotrichum gorgonifer TaxID=2041049 RepID=A0AAE8SYE1_9PEZI|nr:related to phosphatidic acid-preferring phospholipase A1 [Cephalotrichum gorgonifer]